MLVYLYINVGISLYVVLYAHAEYTLYFWYGGIGGRVLLGVEL